MEAKELRIGNYVHDRLHREVVVKQIREDHLIFYLSNDSKIKHNIKTFQPIGLTEEWLLKFGFEKDGVLIDYAVCISNSKILGIDLKNKRAHCYHITPSVQGANLCSIKYVHQLQNLYFGLTGDELKTE
jgi:hypothetical protein